MEFVQPFGPIIGRTTAPESHVTFVNDYVDELSRRDDRANFNYADQLVGNVSQEISLRPEGVGQARREQYRAFLRFLDESVNRYLSSANTVAGLERPDTERPRRLEEWSIWVVRQFQGEYNPVHTHLKYDVSGVLYTKVPAELSAPRPYRDKGSRDGTLDFIAGPEQRLCNGRYNVRPEVGLMLVFPSFLFHAVYPFTHSLEERRCLSFNVMALDDE